MLKRFIAFCLAGYDMKSQEIQKKTRLLLISLMLLFVVDLTCIPVIVLGLIERATGIMLMIALGIYAFGIFLIRKKRFRAASGMAVGILLLTMAATVFSTTVTNEYQIGFNGVIFAMVIAISVVFSFNALQIILVTGLSIASLLGAFFVVFVPALGGAGPSALIALVATCGVLGLIGFFGVLAFSMTRDLVRMAGVEASANAERALAVAGVLETARSGVAIGESLKTLSMDSLKFGEQIGKEMTEINERIVTLSGKLDQSSAVNIEVASSAAAVKDLLDGQRESVNETSSSVEEIVGSIGAISASAKMRKEAMEGLVRTTKDGAEAVTQASGHLVSMKQAAEDILGVIKIIGGIAKQTNLLAMNAAIEAAHAGQYGAGFSVVSEEIRKLAEDADRNSKSIGKSLKANAAAIEQALALNGRVETVFASIRDESGAVSAAMTEIMHGMEEISAGASQILAATGSLTRSSSGISGTMDKVQGKMKEEREVLESIADFTRTLREKSDSITAVVARSIEKTREVYGIGEKNVQFATDLNKDIEAISSGS